MHELTRAVRFCINPEPWEVSASQPRSNTFASWPAIRGLGRYYELLVHCRGEPGETTGYVVSASDVDSVVRDHALPLIAQTAETAPQTDPAALLPTVFNTIRSSASFEITRLTWRLTPYHALSMNTSNTGEVLFAVDFEFAASHRLDCPDLSPEENRRVFGKCNNPNGHGHNYRVRPVVAMPADAAEDGIPMIERIVAEQILQRFDHKHLNDDVAEFADLNPSVEHITRVCFDLLRQPMADAGGRLVEVTVWETDKTSCTYSTPD